MDRSLIEAAINGDVEKLLTMIEQNPFLFKSTSEGDNLLHIACCMGSHVHFVKQILNLYSHFARELNPDGFSPLHIASASGYTEIVTELVKWDNDLCLVVGKDKRIPLHCAVVKGRVNVIKELLRFCSDSVEEVTARGESCLHLAVKNNQFEAFTALFDHVVLCNKEYVLNMKDEHGNNILHLAALTKQYEVVDLLLDEKFALKDKLEVNIANKKGLTPLDVLTSEGGDSGIEEMLRRSGDVSNQKTPQSPVVEGSPVNDQVSGQGQTMTSSPTRPRPRRKSALKELEDYFTYDRTKNSPEKARNTLLVVVVLIMTTTYQAVLSPPGGIWQDSQPDSSSSDNNTTTDGYSLLPHVAGKAVMGTINPMVYGGFLMCNSFGFFMSMHMMYFLTNGFPLQFELRLALFALTVTYDICMSVIAPSGVIAKFFSVLSMAMPIMVVLLSMLRDFKKRRPVQTKQHSNGNTV